MAHGAARIVSRWGVLKKGLLLHVRKPLKSMLTNMGGCKRMTLNKWHTQIS